ncbi:MAG TPA: RNA degradosome polyphosphate kinase [Dermatophilaceae bacterium]|nr:RNA degradosome polyphosphate kinase [Dermatophilaceae bacterium]
MRVLPSVSRPGSGPPRARGSNGRFVRVGASAPGGQALPSDRFLEREMSWLQFNERVLQLATDESLFLLERARFLAIFASNLDEFFMVRVAGLKRRIATGLAVRSAAGLEPRELLERIFACTHRLMTAHARVFHDAVRPGLAAQGIHLISWAELSREERDRLGQWFRNQVFPVLTPLAVDPAHPFPYISGLSLNLAVVLVNTKTGTEHFARLKVPPVLPRLVKVSDPGSPDGEGDLARFVPLEEIIAAHLDRLFPGMEVREHYAFRVTRNEDLEVEEDDAENLLTALEKELTRRRFGPPVRLEVAADMDERLLRMLMREMQVSPREVFRLPVPLDLRSLHAIADLDRTELKYPSFVPRTHPDLARVESAKPANLFNAMRYKDVLVQHPYIAFSTSVQAFIEQAAADSKVLALKQTLYRTSGDSPIIDALIDAAEAGKQVLAVVEIKARFDEQNNIDWARKLEQAGVHVVYGVVGLKTHCKLSLVVRQESDGLRRYCHVGTGNYHPKTARLYEDFGLLTCDPQVGEDLTKLFNQLSGWAPRSTYKRLLVAPHSLRSGLLDKIEEQTAKAKAGLDAYIGLKVNSMVDESVIDGLYRASRAGVDVDALVRGICALRPGVPGLSENIRVRSILGRFLEHSRCFVFGREGEHGVLIGSADLMHRNLDRRVEALVFLRDPGHIEQLVHMLRRGMGAGVASWHLQADGEWVRRRADAAGGPLIDLQNLLIEEHSARRRRLPVSD